jgi:hypothetical protein
MAGKNDDAVGWLFVIAIAGCAWYSFDWNFLGDQITDYVLECSLYDSSGRCIGAYVQGPVTTYTAHADQQVVVSQVHGEPPTRLTKCAVVDWNNWKCSAADINEYYSVSYTDGAVRDLRLEPWFKHVSRFSWITANAPPKK